MFSAKQVCNKITKLYPEIGVCGIDIDVTKDYSQNAWFIHLKQDTHSLDHFLEFIDAERCLDGKQCISLGLEIAQLKKNITGKQF